MPDDPDNPMTEFQLVSPEAADASAPAPSDAGSLPEEMLAENVGWFCRLRWLVIGSLVAFALASSIAPVAGALGLKVGLVWPFVIAAILIATNAAVLWLQRCLRRSRSPLWAMGNLWTQIVTDLLLLTAVVHYVGSLETHVPFAYLFHIVLACIFLSRRHSLAVTMLACTLYTGLILLEVTLQIAPGGIFAGSNLREAMVAFPPAAALNFATTLGILLIVWYLASHLSAMVRQRDAVLADTNRRLVAAQRERSQHMLRTTHELKAPFAAIHANTQLLLKGYCGELSEEATKVVGRINLRSKRLAEEIQQMLQLANLHSTGQSAAPARLLDLAEIVRWCAEQSAPTAHARGIRIPLDLDPAPYLAVEDHMKMMLGNLVTNAVNYSHDGGEVRVTCRTGEDGSVRITVADDGIGIEPEKLPRIFEEHFRSNRAVAHNRESSGLGLSIVRAVAVSACVDLRVRSRVGEGTTFDASFPPPGRICAKGLA